MLSDVVTKSLGKMEFDFYNFFVISLIVILLLHYSIVLLVWSMSVILTIHKKLLRRNESTNTLGYWNAARDLISRMWCWHGKIFHDHEITGWENIPKKGPALLIYYHGTVPVDCYYVVFKTWLKMRRLISVIADRFLFKLPGWAVIAEAFNVSTGTVESCAKILKAGNLLVISPGGVYEAQFGDNNYEILWRNRLGFAKTAIAAKVPIIPIFTENLREGYRNVETGKSFFEKVYESTRLPLRPVYGSIPVKLRTFIGKPIEFDPKVTPEDLRDKVMAAIEELIVQNQRLPGNMYEALLDRFREKVPVDVAANRKFRKQLKSKAN